MSILSFQSTQRPLHRGTRVSSRSLFCDGILRLPPQGKIIVAKLVDSCTLYLSNSIKSGGVCGNNELEMNSRLETMLKDPNARRRSGESHPKEQVVGSIYNPKEVIRYQVRLTESKPLD